MAVVGWVDTTSPALEQDWADAPVDDAVLTSYLGAAHEQCVAFLPHTRDELTGVLVPVIPNPVPARLVKAQIMQARAIYRSVLAGDGNGIGTDGLQITVFPMDWTVKALLRPKRVGRVL